MNTFDEANGEIVPSFTGVNQPSYPRGNKRDMEMPHEAPFAATPDAQVVPIDPEQPMPAQGESITQNHPSARIIGHEAHIITVPTEEANPSRRVPDSIRKARAALPKSDPSQHDRIIDDAHKLQARRFFKPTK